MIKSITWVIARGLGGGGLEWGPARSKAQPQAGWGVTLAQAGSARGKRPDLGSSLRMGGIKVRVLETQLGGSRFQGKTCRPVSGG